MVTPRHLGGCNVAFLDGHAERYENIHHNPKCYGSYSHRYGTPTWCWFDVNNNQPFND